MTAGAQTIQDLEARAARLRAEAERMDAAIATLREFFTEAEGTTDGPVTRRLPSAVATGPTRRGRRGGGGPPPATDPLPGLPLLLQRRLTAAGFRTLEALERATDAQLLAVERVGPEKLAKIRAWVKRGLMAQATGRGA